MALAHSSVVVPARPDCFHYICNAAKFYGGKIYGSKICAAYEIFILDKQVETISLYFEHVDASDT